MADASPSQHAVSGKWCHTCLGQLGRATGDLRNRVLLHVTEVRRSATHLRGLLALLQSRSPFVPHLAQAATARPSDRLLALLEHLASGQSPPTYPVCEFDAEPIASAPDASQRPAVAPQESRARKPKRPRTEKQRELELADKVADLEAQLRRAVEDHAAGQSVDLPSSSSSTLLLHDTLGISSSLSPSSTSAPLPTAGLPPTPGHDPASSTASADATGAFSWTPTSFFLRDLDLPHRPPIDFIPIDTWPPQDASGGPPLDIYNISRVSDYAFLSPSHRGGESGRASGSGSNNGGHPPDRAQVQDSARDLPPDATVPSAPHENTISPRASSPPPLHYIPVDTWPPRDSAAPDLYNISGPGDNYVPPSVLPVDVPTQKSPDSVFQQLLWPGCVPRLPVPSIERSDAALSLYAAGQRLFRPPRSSSTSSPSSSSTSRSPPSSSIRPASCRASPCRPPMIASLTRP